MAIIRRVEQHERSECLARLTWVYCVNSRGVRPISVEHSAQTGLAQQD